MLKPVALNPVTTPVMRFASKQKTLPQFGSERQENAGLLVAGLAVGWGAYKLLQQARKRGGEKKLTSPPAVSITQRADGSLVINEGRDDFYLKSTQDCESGVLVANGKGQQIMFVQKTGDHGRMERTVDRLI